MSQDWQSAVYLADLNHSSLFLRLGMIEETRVHSYPGGLSMILRPSFWQAALAATISALTLYLACRSTDPARLWSVLKGVNGS